MNGSYLKFPQGLKPECFLEPDGAAESRALSRQDYRILSSSSPAKAGDLFIFARHRRKCGAGDNRDPSLRLG